MRSDFPELGRNEATRDPRVSAGSAHPSRQLAHPEGQLEREGTGPGASSGRLRWPRVANVARGTLGLKNDLTSLWNSDVTGHPIVTP